MKDKMPVKLTKKLKVQPKKSAGKPGFSVDAQVKGVTKAFLLNPKAVEAASPTADLQDKLNKIAENVVSKNPNK